MRENRTPFARRAAELWLALWGLAAFAVFVGENLGIFSGLERHHLERAHQGLSLLHPFGFDAFGRDLLTITLQASVRSVFFASIATAAAALLSVGAGSLMSVASPFARFIFQRFLETFLAFPSLLFALAWAAVRGPGWDTLAVALLLGSVPSFTRLIQARATELLNEDFVLASRSLGAGPWRIALRHLAPHMMAMVRVKAPNLFASALMAEATLSFLGIGAPIGRSTWGSLLAQGKDYLLESPHLAIGSGLPLVLTILSLQSLSGHSRARSSASF